jgi:hypothetical protein
MFLFFFWQANANNERSDGSGNAYANRKHKQSSGVTGVFEAKEKHPCLFVLFAVQIFSLESIQNLIHSSKSNF